MQLPSRARRRALQRFRQPPPRAGRDALRQRIEREEAALGDFAILERRRRASRRRTGRARCDRWDDWRGWSKSRSAPARRSPRRRLPPPSRASLRPAPFSPGSTPPPGQMPAALIGMADQQHAAFAIARKPAHAQRHRPLEAPPEMENRRERGSSADAPAARHCRPVRRFCSGCIGLSGCNRWNPSCARSDERRAFDRSITAHRACGGIRALSWAPQ